MPVEVFIHRTIELGTWLLDATVSGWACVWLAGGWLLSISMLEGAGSWAGVGIQV